MIFRAKYNVEAPPDLEAAPPPPREVARADEPRRWARAAASARTCWREARRGHATAFLAAAREPGGLFGRRRSGGWGGNLRRLGFGGRGLPRLRGATRNPGSMREKCPDVSGISV